MAQSTPIYYIKWALLTLNLAPLYIIIMTNNKCIFDLLNYLKITIRITKYERFVFNFQIWYCEVAWIFLPFENSFVTKCYAVFYLFFSLSLCYTLTNTHTHGSSRAVALFPHTVKTCPMSKNKTIKFSYKKNKTEGSLVQAAG